MLLELKDLTITFDGPSGTIRAVDRVSFSLDAGETLALVGETGCGKSVLCRSIPGLLPRRGRVTGGQILFEGQNLAGLTEKALRPFRGGNIGMVFQNPRTAFDPAMTVGEQLKEALWLGGSRDAFREAAHWLELVGIDRPEQRMDQYPAAFSGGMLQRAAIAMALCRRPRLLLADEPTTALDVTVQAHILDLMKRLQKETGVAILFVTHDLAVAAQVADRAAVMSGGRFVSVLSAALGKEAKSAPAAAQGTQPLLEVRELGKSFRSGGTVLQAVGGVSFTLKKGEIFGLVGESGAGKTTLGQCIAGLQKQTEGTVRFYGGNIQIIFQDSAWAVNPRMTLEEIVAEPLEIKKRGIRAQRKDRAHELLELVELGPEFFRRYPSECSGGQLQRAAIARALAAEPELLVADEPLASQDRSSQLRMTALLERLRRELGLSVLLITHDLFMVRQCCAEVAVMKGGQVVEQGTTEQIYERPAHPYTKELMASIPPWPGSALLDKLGASVL